jgi:hypothetical protein
MITSGIGSLSTLHSSWRSGARATEAIPPSKAMGWLAALPEGDSPETAFLAAVGNTSEKFDPSRFASGSCLGPVLSNSEHGKKALGPQASSSIDQLTFR